MHKITYIILSLILLGGCTSNKKNINLNFSIPPVEYVEK